MHICTLLSSGNLHKFNPWPICLCCHVPFNLINVSEWLLSSKSNIQSQKTSRSRLWGKHPQRAGGMNGSGQLRWASTLNNPGETKKAQNFIYQVLFLLLNFSMIFRLWREYSPLRSDYQLRLAEFKLSTLLWPFPVPTRLEDSSHQSAQCVGLTFCVLYS